MDAGAFAGGAAGGLGGPSRDWRSHNKDRDPPPSLGGENPAHNPKRSGKALRFWKHNTAVPQSLAAASYTRRCRSGPRTMAADLLPEEVILSEKV